MNSYSVLMSVYSLVEPAFLEESLASMFAQTAPPDDFVLVCDGPLNRGLDEVIEKFALLYPAVLTVLRLPVNVGIGAAAQAGLGRCRNGLVAKMDSDDIARPYRCERQLKAFADDNSLGLLGGHLAEFIDTPSNTVMLRRVPLDHQDILRCARRRMPFNNQTLMYKKSEVEKAGGYSPLRRCEDYELCLRLLQAGVKARNLDEVLVDYRLDENAYARRAAWGNYRAVLGVHWKKIPIRIFVVLGFHGDGGHAQPDVSDARLRQKPDIQKNSAVKKLVNIWTEGKIFSFSSRLPPLF